MGLCHSVCRYLDRLRIFVCTRACAMEREYEREKEDEREKEKETETERKREDKESACPGVRRRIHGCARD